MAPLFPGLVHWVIFVVGFLWHLYGLLFLLALSSSFELLSRCNAFLDLVDIFLDALIQTNKLRMDIFNNGMGPESSIG